MAPVPEPELVQEQVQEEIKNVIQDLLQIMAQVSNYDTAGRPTRDALVSDIQSLDQSLQAVHRTATAMQQSSSSVPPGEIIGPGDVGIPETLIHYVENGRNPDIYTREFVELVRRMNQLARGKLGAFAAFGDVLAHEMEAALPELREDVRLVVEATGGGGTGGEVNSRPAETGTATPGQ
ncbi:RNA polymerase II mediator complex subunit [Echria macrotheca]|uniref:Mediator of RNA polymerase II transcription subunit 10 n=1 Tax=Echria macrotheca TaxID=438768 RepID=A0AAJ0BDF5_9PEZI|nr:RNA polymerase II mediator complex subunit [Echria macrotheca]